MDVPVIATRHVQKNFGDIAEEIKSVDHPGRKLFDKTKFSMLEDPVLAHLKSLGSERDQIVLYGVEAHVCVKQTCFDLMDMGYNVHLVIDALSSMNHHDRNTGIESMKLNGAQVTTFQSLAFEMMRDYTHPLFKSVFPLIKDMPAEGHIDIFYHPNM